MMWVLYLLLSAFTTLFFYIRHRDILHPNMIFLLIWFLGSFLTNYVTNFYLKTWSAEMHFVVLLSGLFFFLGSLPYSTPLRNSKRDRVINHIRVSTRLINVVNIVFIFCTICVFIEWKVGGMQIVNFQKNLGGVDVKSELAGGIPGIHYGTIFFPFTAVIYFYIYLNSKKTNFKTLIIILFIVIVSIFTELSRGTLLMIIFAFLFIYTRYYFFNIKQIIIAAAVILISIIGIMFTRVNDQSIVMTMTDDPYFSIFYSYIATSYANLNDLINSSVNYHPFGDATFSPLWTTLGLKDDTNTLLIDQMGVFNALPYNYDYYHDYKFFGIIFFPFILGMVISKIYQLIYVGKKYYYVILLGIMQKAIFVNFFGDYFFGEMVLFFPYLLTFIIIFCCTNIFKK